MLLDGLPLTDRIRFQFGKPRGVPELGQNRLDDAAVFAKLFVQ